MSTDDQPTTASPAASEDLEKASLDTVYEKLGASPKGLTSTEAKARIEKYGRNELVDKEASDMSPVTDSWTLGLGVNAPFGVETNWQQGS
jgi:hypothetical protein